MISKPLEDFLNYLRECEQQYHMAEADEQEANGVTVDIQHQLELEENGDKRLLELAKELTEARRLRRKAKDSMNQLGPVLAWVDKNRGNIKSLEQLLGEVRKAERDAENRIYTPRTKRKEG